MGSEVMEYTFTHICKEATDTEKRQGMLFSRYIRDGEHLQAKCPGCGETTTDAVPLYGNRKAKPNRGVIQDIEPYKSPLDGSIVGSRSRHRDHMREHGVIEMGNEYPKGRE